MCQIAKAIFYNLVEGIYEISIINSLVRILPIYAGRSVDCYVWSINNLIFRNHNSLYNMVVIEYNVARLYEVILTAVFIL